MDDPLMKQISIFVFMVAAVTDWYDGWLARKFNYITAWGQFLDPLADKILTSAAFIGFVILGILPAWMVIVIVIRDFLITGLRAYAEFRKHYFTTSKSAKWKTFLQMTFIYYLLVVYTLGTFQVVVVDYKYIYDLLSDATIIYFSMLGVTLFTLITGIQYIVKNKKLIKKLFTVED
jgi:CDP-diacylglycerol--glycerol-3-phosphate 3-phosphatidyltransferase